MRKMMLVGAAVLVTAAVGCGSKPTPVSVTPEMEAEQKEMDKRVRNEETLQQKNQKMSGKPSAEDEEAARAKKQRN
ncbi:hypothetical protein VT84_20725 [Gemmata sp. SH-PL17]|uniref:hypothetical protein n=1 Tax=Gemmata sp. SH-PL17 TaxID=1630693 RepID=UPI00078E2103|nr:hypothetical protein [Gemmata sp. SH-PL17]AMV26837.1 hypothetical protein VT84_20725 [Gemmata sp. SH-PL17]